MSVVANPRIRVRFSKTGKVRFTSHRDVARIWERALRRVALPVAYSEGFSPRPKLSYGLALPTGYESAGEYLDVELDRERVEELELGQVLGAGLESDLGQRLNRVLPEGIRVQAIAPVERGGESLQQAVIACTWEIELAGAGSGEVEAWASGILAADEILLERERKGKKVIDDVRPLVHALDVVERGGDAVWVIAVLGTQPRALRPTELLEARLEGKVAGTHPPLTARSVCRMNQWMLREAQESREFQKSRNQEKITQGDARVEPLSVDAGPATLVETRA